MTAKFVKLVRPGQLLRSATVANLSQFIGGEDDGLNVDQAAVEEVAAPAAPSYSEGKKLAANVGAGNITQVQETDEDGICIIRFNDAREGVKIMGTLDQVVEALGGWL